MVIEMQPIPESSEALSRLSERTGEDLVKQLKAATQHVLQAVPDCVAISFTHFQDNLTFTLVAPSEQLRLLVAGPAADHDPPESDGAESQDPRQIFGLTHALDGVRSSLSLPLQRHGQIYGSLDLYAAGEYAFTGREDTLAMMFNAAVQEAVTNVDLYMSTLASALEAPQTLDELEVIDKAVGALMVRQEMSFQEAYRSLIAAADRAGVSPVDLAGLVLRQRSLRSG